MGRCGVQVREKVQVWGVRGTCKCGLAGRSVTLFLNPPIWHFSCQAALFVHALLPTSPFPPSGPSHHHSRRPGHGRGTSPRCSRPSPLPSAPSPFPPSGPSHRHPRRPGRGRGTGPADRAGCADRPPHTALEWPGLRGHEGVGGWLSLPLHLSDSLSLPPFLSLPLHCSPPTCSSAAASRGPSTRLEIMGRCGRRADSTCITLWVQGRGGGGRLAQV